MKENNMKSWRRSKSAPPHRWYMRGSLQWVFKSKKNNHEPKTTNLLLGFFSRHQNTIFYDHMVSRRLISVIAAWHGKYIFGTVNINNIYILYNWSK